MPGPVALVGSGEFLDGMRDTDAGLLEGRAQRAVFLPTAAAEEGAERVEYWLELGSRHYESMGIEAVPLPVLDRDDASSSWAVEGIAGAGLVYLSGGDPGYLAETLRDTPVWTAIEAAWLGGTAVAGCSAGACALTAVANRVRSRTTAGLAGAGTGTGLGLIPQLAVVPHFDLFRRRAPQLVASIRLSVPEGVTLVGIDEDTALVGGPVRFAVEGRAKVWVYTEGGATEPEPYGAGSTIELPRRWLTGGGVFPRTPQPAQAAAAAAGRAARLS